VRRVFVGPNRDCHSNATYYAASLKTNQRNFRACLAIVLYVLNFRIFQIMDDKIILSQYMTHSCKPATSGINLESWGSWVRVWISRSWLL